MVTSSAWRWVAVIGLAVELILSACGGAASPAGVASPLCPTEEATAEATPEAGTWTVMIYLAVDNDLGDMAGTGAVDNMGAQMLESIKTGASDPNVKQRLNIVVLYDQFGPENTQIWVSGKGEGELKPVGSSVNDLLGLPGAKEVNTGNQETLTNFVIWAKDNYSADCYFLSLVSHGYGIAPENVTATASSRSPAYASLALVPPNAPSHWGLGGTGLSVDYTDAQNNNLYNTNIDSLSTQELRLGLEKSHVDILFFHACLMSMLEVAYEVRGSTDYIIAGENYLFGPGRYDDYLAALATQAGSPPQDVATTWAEHYFNSIAPSQSPVEYPLEVGVIKAGELDNVQSAWRSLTDALFASPEDWQSGLEQASMNAQHFDSDSDFEIETTDGYVDAYSLANAIEMQFTDGDTISAAQAAKAAIDGAIVWTSAEQPVWIASGGYTDPQGATHSWSLDASRGLSIFLPVSEDLWVGGGCTPGPGPGCYSLRENYTSANFVFVGATKWGELVEGLTPTSIQTVTEPRPGLLRRPEQ